MALIDIVEWKNTKEEIIYRFPEGAISLGGQVFVQENQEAILFKEGRALDVFSPGRHTLVTGNIPILEKLVNLPFGGKSPFPAEIYFINKMEVPNLKWGTKIPMQILDPIYNLAIPVRAFGSYSIKIKDVKAFLVTAIGTWQAFTTEAVSTAIRDLIILPKLQDLIAEFMLKQNITVLKLAAQYDEIGVAGKDKIAGEFESLNLELLRFVVESINVPDDDESVIRLKKALADKAEIDIMGDKYQMKRTFDTMEKAAGNEGMAGGMMGAGMGAGMGLGMGNMMGNAMGGAMAGGLAGGAAGGQKACPHCNTANPANGKFCSSCGKEMVVAMMACPKCNAQIPAGSKFCPSCGTNTQGVPCVKCNAKLQPGAKFCPECGAQQG